MPVSQQARFRGRTTYRVQMFGGRAPSLTINVGRRDKFDVARGSRSRDEATANLGVAFSIEIKREFARNMGAKDPQLRPGSRYALDVTPRCRHRSPRVQPTDVAPAINALFANEEFHDFIPDKIASTASGCDSMSMCEKFCGNAKQPTQVLHFWQKPTRATVGNACTWLVAQQQYRDDHSPAESAPQSRAFHDCKPRRVNCVRWRPSRSAPRSML